MKARLLFRAEKSKIADVQSVAATGVTANSILAGPTESEREGGFVEVMARQENKSKKEIEKKFFENMHEHRHGDEACIGMRGTSARRLHQL
jgi:hypothetical protein